MQHKVAQVLERSLSGLSGIVKEARRIAPFSVGRTDMEEIAKRYTMQSQRRIHESHLDHKAAAIPVASSQDHDLGGNVDLF